MSTRRWIWSAVSLVMILAVLAACATPTPQVIEKTVEVETIVEKTVEVEVEKTVEVEKIVEVTAVPTGPGVFAGAYPYTVPPVGHINFFATNNMGLGIYRWFFQPPMTAYNWADGTWRNFLAESWEIDNDAATLTIYLKKGIKWSNGDEFNAEDVIATFNCRRLVKGTVWRFLESVTAKDDYTVVFQMSEPSTVVEWYAIKEPIVDRVRPEWSDKVQALVDEGLDNTTDEWNALLQEFNAFDHGA